MAEGNRWTNLLPDGSISNDKDELAGLNKSTTMWSPYMPRFVFTDWAVEDGSFLRLNTLTLGYTLPRDVIGKAYIQNLRFYISGYNVFLWTNYSGFDPEVSTRRRTPLTPGVDYSAYPRSRSVVFGMNLSF
jgi:TonB-dependent starch-binding outer membrane protein SusC